MSHHQPPYPGYQAYPDYPERPSTGLGVAALVLGIVAIVTLVVCGFGILVAVAGLIVGLVAAARNRGRGMAVAGIVLSALTLVLGGLLLYWLYQRVRPCADLPEGPARDHCIERRLPFARATPTPY